MNVLLLATTAATGAAVLGVAPAHADPWGHPGECHSLGQNYNGWYP